MTLKNLLAVALATVILAACSGKVEDTLPGQPIKHRQEAFQELLRSFEPMGTMLRTNRYEADPFVDMTSRFIERRDAPWQYFTKDSFQPPTRAKEAVWSRADEFEGRRQAFLEATDKLLEAANSGELASVRTAYSAVEATCRSCHDDFRN